jgi:hypothetical protein
MNDKNLRLCLLTFVALPWGRRCSASRTARLSYWTETDNSRALMTVGSSRHRSDGFFERDALFACVLEKERRVYLVK